MEPGRGLKAKSHEGKEALGVPLYFVAYITLQHTLPKGRRTHKKIAFLNFQNKRIDLNQECAKHY